MSPASTIVQTKGIGSNSDHQDERIQQDSTAIYTQEERQNYLTDKIYIATEITWSHKYDTINPHTSDTCRGTNFVKNNEAK